MAWRSSWRRLKAQEEQLSPQRQEETGVPVQRSTCNSQGEVSFHFRLYQLDKPVLALCHCDRALETSTWKEKENIKTNLL